MQHNYKPHMVRKLESRAVQMGSNPLDWYGSLEDLSIKDMVIQRMNDKHEWVSA